MAVNSTNRKAGPFIGNGATSTFPFSFKVFQASDLFVTTIINGSDDENVIILNTDYSVALNGDQDNNPGGTIDLIDGPLATNYRMVITSAVPELQQVVLTNGGGFYPDTLNDVFDKLTILIQQLQVAIGLAVSVPLTDPAINLQLPSAIDRANKYLAFGSDGSPMAVDPNASTPSGTALFSGVLLETPDGVRTVFTLTNGGSPISKSPLLSFVWKNFPLILGDPFGYSLGPTAGQITFAQAPKATDSLYGSGVISQ